MKIIERSATLTTADLYAMTKGNTARGMKDAVGETLEITGYVLYSDTNSKGEEVEVLSLRTADGIYTTNSRTFIRNFRDILEIFEEGGEAAPSRYLVGQKMSKSNRPYLTCDIGL